MKKTNLIYQILLLNAALLLLNACSTCKQVEFDVFYSEKGYKNFTYNSVKPKEFIKNDSLFALLEKVSKETVYDCFILQIYNQTDTLQNLKLDVSDTIHIKITSDLLENISEHINYFQSQNLINGVFHFENDNIKSVFVICKNKALFNKLFNETKQKVEFKHRTPIKIPKYVRMMYFPDAYSRINGIIYRNEFELHFLEIDGNILFKQ